MEERRFKVIPADVLKKVRSANNVQVECSTSKNTGVSTFIIKGKAEDVQKARRDLIKGLTVHITETIKVPASSRASIIGPKGSNLRPIEEKRVLRSRLLRSLRLLSLLTRMMSLLSMLSLKVTVKVLKLLRRKSRQLSLLVFAMLI